jgi:hypothetical protein
MNPIISAKSLRTIRRSPALKQLLRRGVSTQELDATKGGKSSFGGSWSVLIVFRS